MAIDYFRCTCFGWKKRLGAHELITYGFMGLDFAFMWDMIRT